MQQFIEGGISNSRSVPAEQKAFVFQLDFGLNVGLAPNEAKYLKELISNPEKLKDYYNSPIK
jgi:hypothetical protein